METVDFEMFSNSYNLFMLIIPRKRHFFARSVRLVSTAEEPSDYFPSR